jgi:hypothetical protein
MTFTAHIFFVLPLLLGCASTPAPASDVPTDNAAVDTSTTDVPTARDAGSDATADVFNDTPGDTRPDAVSDASSDVLLRNGCPVLEEPVDRMGAAPAGDTYADFARGFFTRLCVRCHSTTLTTPEARMGAPNDFNWDNEAGVRRELMRIRRAVGIDNYMPIGTPEATCAERRRLVRWIDIGAP